MAWARGSERIISNPSQGFPRLASSDVALANLDSNSVLAAWLDSGSGGDALQYEIHAELLSQSGATNDRTVSSAFAIGPRTTQTALSDPEITAIGGGGLAVVHGTGTFNYNTGQTTDYIVVKTYPDGTTLTPTAGLLLGDATLIDRDAAATHLQNGRFVVTWEQRGQHPTLPNIDQTKLLGAIVDRNGNIIQQFTAWTADWDRVSGPPAHALSSATSTLADGRFVVTWTAGTNDADIRGGIFDAGGTMVGSTFLVNAATAGDQKESVVTGLANGGFATAWVDTAVGSADRGSVKLQLFDASGNRSGAEILVNGTIGGADPHIAMLGDGNFAISWTEWGTTPSNSKIVVQVFDAFGTKVGAEQPVANGATHSDIAASGLHDFVVAWDGSDGRIHSQQFSSLPSDFEHGVLIQNRITHELNFLKVDGTALTASMLLPGGFWPVVGTGDFNNDGQLDLITHANGQINFVHFQGSTLTSSQLVSGAYWDVKGAGQSGNAASALADGPAIVTQDEATGQINLLGFKGGNLVGSLLLQGSGYWDVVGVGDFNGDGKDDYVTQHNGQINFLFFEGTELGSGLIVHNQKMTAAAIQMAEKKVWAHRS